MQNFGESLMSNILWSREKPGKIQNLANNIHSLT